MTFGKERLTPINLEGDGNSSVCQWTCLRIFKGPGRTQKCSAVSLNTLVTLDMHYFYPTCTWADGS